MYPGLTSLTYEQAEMRYGNGRLSQEEWEYYCYLWRNSCFRFSNLAASYEDPGKEEEEA